MKKMNLMAAFFSFCFLTVVEAKCLKEYPDLSYERNFYYNGMNLPIVIESSDRASHLFVSNILYILLYEVLKYRSVRMIYNGNPTDYQEAVSRLTNLSEDGVPRSMVNLEVWSPHGRHVESDDLTEAGPLGPIGMYGWFVPSRDVDKFWKKSGVTLNHWRSLTLSNVTKLFSLDSHVHTIESELVWNTRDEGSWCEQLYEHCRRGVLTVNRTLCHDTRDDNCALLVSSFPDTDRGFVVEQIEKLNIQSRVTWIGNNLGSFISKMLQADQPVLFFNWVPNDVTSIGNFELIHFPFHLSYKHSAKNSLSKQYTLVKMLWKVIKSHLPEVYHLISNFHFTQQELEQELSKFPLDWNVLSSDDIIQQLACDWLKHNTKKWKTWIPPKAVRKMPVYLVGLFPKTHPSTEEGALVAVEMLNDDNVTLRDYELFLFGSKISCEREVAVDNFLKSAQNDIHPTSVFIGPGCYEAADPVVSLSKYFNKLVISFGSELENKENPPSSYLFFDIMPNMNHVGDVCVCVFKLWNWSQVALISQEDDIFKDYQSVLKEKLVSNNIEIIFESHFTKLLTIKKAQNVVRLLKLSQARIIILVSDSRLSLMILCMAYKMEVSGFYGYIWLLPHGVMQMDRTYLENECSRNDLFESLKGSFIVAPSSFGLLDAASSVGVSTTREWADLYHARLGALNMEKSLYGSYAFDAVLSFGLALDSLLQEDPSCVESLDTKETARKLSSHLKSLHFNGATGLVSFEGFQRVGSFDIKQVQENGNVLVVGKFNPSKNSSEQLFLNESLMQWFHSGVFPPLVVAGHTCSVEGLRKLLNVKCDFAIIIINITCFTLLLISVIGCLIFIKRRYDIKVRATCERMEELGLFSQDTSWLCLDQWEVSRDNVVLNRKLGEGAFGTVFGGEANINGVWMAAAVKTLKISSKPDEKLNFLSEAEMMKRFNHENIVKLLGVCTRGEPALTIMEFMLHGDLKTFLLSRRQLVGQLGREAEDVSPFQLTKMALDVAHGLLYLSSLNYVHRDIACRNCLVHANKTVKIGDFGMTRSMNDSDYYRFNKRGMFPVRWMAPESLSDGLFGTASDVWSYGVLLYEIITFGSFPYQGLSNRQVLNFVKSGNILSMPAGCPPKMESLLKKCWSCDPKSRPKVTEVMEILTEMPALLVPCLDTPSTSVNTDGPWSLEMSLLPRVRHRNQYQKNLLVCDRMSAPAPSLNQSTNIISSRLSSPPFCHHIGESNHGNETNDVKPELGSCNLSSQEKEPKNSDRQGSGTIMQCEMDESFLSQDTTHLCHTNIYSESKVKDGCLISIKRSLSADDKALFDARHWSNVSSRICRLYNDKIKSKIEEIKKTDKTTNEKSSIKRRTLLPMLSGLGEQEGFATEPRQNNRKSMVGPQQLTCDSRTDSDYCSQHSKDFSAHLGTALL